MTQLFLENCSLQGKPERGAEIRDIIHVTRDEPIPQLYENTYFSVDTKSSIKQGESKETENKQQNYLLFYPLCYIGNKEQ